MVEETAQARPPMWKSFMVGLLLISLVLGPAVGLMFYFYTPLTTYFQWYVGTTMLLGVGVGVGLAALAALVFASRASG